MNISTITYGESNIRLQIPTWYFSEWILLNFKIVPYPQECDSAQRMSKKM